MAARRSDGRRGIPLWPWVLLIGWIAFIWGHSFIAGPESSAESMRVVALIRRFVYHFGLQRYAIVQRLMTDPQLVHYLVRKGAHFSEYFVLGLLTFVALKLTFSNPFLGLCALVGLWVSVPTIDEYIQRFIPQRSGQLTDVLLDMSGFATSFALCLLVSLLSGGRRRRA